MFLDFKKHISVIPDWPSKGIITYDIAPILHDSRLFHELIEQLSGPYKNQKIDTVIGIEARGFILAGALANQLGSGMVLIRKKGKTPPPTISQEYSFEYASYVMEVAGNILQPNEQVVLVDDILATGGTMAAAVKLINKIGSKIIGISCAVEMESMAGRDRLKGQKIYSSIIYT
ncbi:adenine phosphoribosyltransferase [Candidatus Peregrinibacteria bacterium]|nr:adenine phosphoribosyltransferase [Candidatus Peregrinibacteria bacterium]